MSEDTLDALDYLRRLEKGLVDGRVVLNSRVEVDTEKETRKEAEIINRIGSLFGKE